MSKKIKNYIILAFTVILTLGAVFAITRISQDKKERVVLATEFVSGSLDENGKCISSKTSLYTKNLIACQGLKIVPDFDSTINYRIFWYNIEKEYVNHTDLLSETFDDELAPAIRYCRIVIERTDGEEITLFNKLSTANQLKVSVNNNQVAYSPLKLEKTEVFFSDNTKILLLNNSFTALNGKNITSIKFTFNKNVSILDAPLSYLLSYYTDSTFNTIKDNIDMVLIKMTPKLL